MRKIYFILFCLVFCFSLSAQTGSTDVNTAAEMDRIRSNPSYRYGEAYEVSFNDAREKARKDLFSKLKTTLISKQVLENEEFSSTTTAITVGAIENLKEIYTADNKGYNVIAYISEEDLKQAEDERKNLIIDFIAMGKQHEGLLNISEALKYYTWAYRMLNLYQDKVSVETPAGQRNALSWLTNHIPGILSNITINIPEEKISEDEGAYDRYMVTFEAKYNGVPVSMLDISYYDGEKQVSPVHCKNGEGVMTFHTLAPNAEVPMKIIYDFAEDGRNAGASVAAVYAKGFPQLKSFNEKASLRVPLKIKKDRTQKTASRPEYSVRSLSEADMEALADAAPIVVEPKKSLARSFEEDKVKFAVMKKVEDAIRKKTYREVESEFTPEGFKIFEMMMGSGNVSVCKKDIPYTVECSGNFIIGKGIPVAIKKGKHISNENIVFRFDAESGKIRSVAYALTKRAEDDIFREGAQWTLESRYALVQFMEDYQTAYSLMRLDYISSIFSDDAVIIVGKVDNKPSKRFMSHNDLKGISVGKKVSYTKFNKETYLAKLKEDFAKKNYIQLVFEDTKVEKVADAGYVNNDILWIELKQKYSSSSYSDEGYLALQINLRPSGSLINVRTWTPYFVPIRDLKAAFPIGDSFANHE